MIVQPPHRDLDDIVQDLEGDGCGDFDHAPDQGIGIVELDAERGDLGEAIDGAACGHAACDSTAASLRQFQGSRSSRRLAGCSAMRARTSASQA
jgi:hypothetical protein